jgi:hypothetical protein
MKLHEVRTVKRLNVEHRTPNFERPILIALRFIYFRVSEPPNPPEADKFRMDDSLAQYNQRVLLSIF